MVSCWGSQEKAERKLLDVVKDMWMVDTSEEDTDSGLDWGGALEGEQPKGKEKLIQTSN